VDGFVTAVRVRIDGLSHGTPQNLDLLLVSPDGKVAALMCDAGRSYRVRDALLMFDDSATGDIPGYNAIVPGRYRPANHGTDQEIPPPGTTGPIGTNLTALAENGANGEWKLYITDDHEGDTGSIDGWSISFETKPYPGVNFGTETMVTSEGGQATAITATLTEAAPVEVTVPFTLSGDACATEDYQISPGPIIIPAGESTGSVTLAPIDDAIAEQSETIILTMAPPTHASPGQATTETIILADNDVTLTIESDAVPPPSTAGDTYTIGTEISVSGPNFDNGEGTRQSCIGWTGSGSVPEEGQGCTATFVIRENSLIRWHHTTEHRLEITTSGTGTVDAESGWLAAGTVATLTVQASPGHHFAGWTVTQGTLQQGSPLDPTISLEMAGPVSLTANFLADPVGRITLEAASGPHPANGGMCDFGRRVTSTGPVIRAFTLRNTGDASLHGIRLLPGGSQAFALAHASIPAEIAPGGSGVFSLSFDPPAADTYSGTLLIECDDEMAAPFVLNLGGTGTTAREEYEEWLATADLSANDGVPGLLKYAFNIAGPAAGQRSLSTAPANAGLPCLTCNNATEPAPSFRLEFLRRKHSGLIYTAQQMDDPAAGTRTPMSGTEVVTEIDADWERVTIEQRLDPENPRRFFTVEVTLPDP
jgi:subtilisin-like proprotein convertase family protein